MKREYKKYPAIEISPRMFAQINGFYPHLISVSEVEIDSDYNTTLNSVCLRKEEILKLLEIIEKEEKAPK